MDGIWTDKLSRSADRRMWPPRDGRWLRRSEPPPEAPPRESAPPEASEVTPLARRRWRCRQCKLEVTSDRDAVEMNGKHTHVCVNPAGIPFDIACFGDAPGCSVRGVPQADWSWFEGYLWRFAHCRGCDQHLGWYYDGSGRGFFGLIRSRLSDEPSTP